MKEPKSIEMRATYEGSAVVQEREGRKYVNLKIPSSFEGHTFALEMSIPGESHQPSGSFRIEFVLGNSFINEQCARDALEFKEGFSNIVLGEQASKIEEVLCFYAPKSQPDQKREARLRLTCRDSDRQLKRLVMLIEEESAEEALRYSISIANQILDVLTYKKGVPLEILRIEIFDDSDGRPVKSYIKFPYKSTKQLVPTDIESVSKVPNRLRAPLRMLREATNSTSPFYRCLCLYRFFEGMEKVRALNNADAKKKGGNLSRPRICVPENELTQQAFPEFANSPLGSFLDHVRKTYRLDIAHMNLNEFENLLLDPGVVGNVHRVDQVNAVLLPMARRSIQAEWEFMLKSEVGVV